MYLLKYDVDLLIEKNLLIKYEDDADNDQNAKLFA